MLYVKMFGHLKIGYSDIDEQEYTYPAKISSFLTYMLLNRSRLIAKEELLDIFWNDTSSSNPVSALKTLIFRTRKILDEQLGAGEYIIEQSGNYRWNPENEVEIDVEVFEKLLLQAESVSNNNAQKIELYEKALELFPEDFLCNSNGYYWLELECGYYRSLASKAVLKLIMLYKKEKNYERLEQVCEDCLKRNMADEDIHYYLILSKIFLNKRQEAKDAYKRANRMLKREYGIESSQKIESLKQRVLHFDNLEHKELEAIYNEIEEENLKGAFICHYDVFKDICRLEYRKMQREMRDTSMQVKQRQLLLLTAQDKNFEIEKEKSNIKDETMKVLLEVIRNSLRAEDVITRCSGNQVLLLMQGGEGRDWLNISQRIVPEVKKKCKNIICDIKYKSLEEEGTI